MSNYLTTDGLKKIFSTSGGRLRPVAFATWLIRHCDHHLISRKSDLDVVTLSRALVYSHLINIEKTYNYPPPPKKETAAIFAKLCALDLFFGRGNDLHK